MENKPQDKLSKPLLPLIMLLMLVILLTVIISNIKLATKQIPFSDRPPIPETTSLTEQNRQLGVSEVTEILSKEEQIILTAIKKYRLGEIEEAENDFRTILVFDPDNQAALSYLGTIFFTQKKYKEAEMLFRKETKVYPGNPAAFRNLALALHYQGKIKDAIVAMKTATDMSPDHPDYLVTLARFYAYTGELEYAERYLLRAENNGVDLESVLQEDLFRPLRLKWKANR